MAEQSTLSLLPEAPPDTVFARVALSELPPDAALGPIQPDAQMRASVAALGVLQPVVLRFRGDPAPDADEELEGPFDVGTGRRRIMAARAAEQGDIPALIVPAATPDHVVAAIDVALNVTPDKNELAYYDRVREMMAAGASAADITRDTGLAKQTIGKLLTLDNLAPELMGALRDGTIKLSVALAAAKLRPAQQQKLVAGPLAEAGKVTGPDVAQARRLGRAEAAQNLSFDTLFEDAPGAEALGPQAGAPFAGDPAAQEAAAALRARLEQIRQADKRTAEGRWTAEDIKAVDTLVTAVLGGGGA